MVSPPLVAVDVGNARTKLALFDQPGDAGIPEPLAVLSLAGDLRELERTESWLEEAVGAGAHKYARCQWLLASVNRPMASRLIDWLRAHRPADPFTLLRNSDLPLEVRLPRPDFVGIDRLVDAVAVNRMRRPGSAAVVVDVGTAITVDVISRDGAFLGGAILPGMAMSARALHEFTDSLPLVDTSVWTGLPPAVGDATVPAIQSGLFWGVIGAVRQLVSEMQKAAADDLTAASAEVFITGGAGAAVAELLAPDARYVPYLTLAGIALAAKVES